MRARMWVWMRVRVRVRVWVWMRARMGLRWQVRHEWLNAAIIQPAFRQSGQLFHVKWASSAAGIESGLVQLSRHAFSFFTTKKRTWREM